MIPLPLAAVAELTGGVVHGDGADAVVRGPVVIDSRAVEPGALFAALRGERAP
ncbi:MAG: UDP-N-acetylmuramoyl-tripeptide--D-alanyl-D-alanine ligase, partial [Actinomadura rubrobrunea]|nr:UDP-N-acetylmuramoyl-tripeptide--D-alanyl-D-alanine ligase [Actinomadura rubrobrunea]